MYLYYSCFDVRAIDTSNVYVLVLLKADTYQSSYVSLESLNPTKSLNTTLLFFFLKKGEDFSLIILKNAL